MNARKLLLAVLVTLGCVAFAALPAWAGSAANRKSGSDLKIESIRVGSKAGPLAIKVEAAVTARLGLRVNGQVVRHGFQFAGKGSQAIELRAADGLRPGANELRIRAMRGGRISTATRTVRVPSWALLADAGEDATARVKVHAELGTAPAVGGKTAGLRYRWRIVKRSKGARALLRGADGPQPLLRAKAPGTYVLRMRADGNGPASFDQVTVAISPDDPPIGVPLNTIDVNNGGAIVIGGQAYGSSPNGSAWVVLQRATRKVVESGSISNDDGGVAKLASLSATYGGGGNYMKYLMIVSGRFGIPAAQAGAFGQFAKSIGVARLGEENFAALRDGQQFSLIGIPGAPSGAGTVRIPGGYSTPTSGAIDGFLQKNQAVDINGSPVYEFVSPEHPSFDTKYQSSATTNTMTVNGNRYPGNLPAGATAGFHVVVFESLTMRLLDNLAIKTNGNGSDRTWQREAGEAIKKAINRPGGALVMVETIGKPKAAGPEWADVVNALGQLGANRQYVNALDGTNEYALVSRWASDLPPAEASTAYDSAFPQSYPPARLVGVFARTRTSTFEPNVTSVPNEANPEGAVNIGLINVAYQAPQAWPDLSPGSPAGETAATQKFICEALNFCQAANSCSQVRDCFWQKYGSDWGLKHSILVSLGYPGDGKGFNQKTFTNVRAQLLTEIAAVANVQHYLTELQEPFDKSATRSYVDLQDISKKIWDSVQRPAGDNSTAWLLGFIGKAVALGGFAPPPVSSAAAGLAAGFGLASYLSAPSGAPILGSEIKARAATLGSEMLDRIDLARKTTIGLGMLIVSDSGKLAIANKHVDSDWSLPTNPATTAEFLRTSSKQWFYEALIPTAFPILIRGNATNARSLDCRDSNRAGWPNQPDSDQMLATTGYDTNGNPIRSIFYFTSGIGGGSSPDGSLGNAMFKPRSGPGETGLGMEKLGFFTPRLFGGKIAHAVTGFYACQVGWLPGKY